MSTESALKPAPKTHPLNPGTPVTVLRLGMMTEPFVEGCAVIKAAGAEPNLYWVAFEGDPIRRLRHVFPACQSPHLPNALLKLWRSEPAIGFNDLFIANDNSSLGRAK